MKKIFFAAVYLFCSLVFAQIRLGVLNGPSCIPAAFLLDNVVSVEGEDLEYEVFPTPQQLVPKILKGEIDAGFMPPNVAAKVYNSSKGNLLCVAVTGYGNLKLITKDTSVSKLSDLKGKTVYVAGQAATPEYIFRYILGKNKIKTEGEDGVTLDFSIPSQQLSAMLVNDKIEYAVVPEPFVTISKALDERVFEAVDLQKEYLTIEGTDLYPLTVMVVSKDFALKKTAAMNKLLDLYRESFEWTMENPFDTGDLCEELGLGLKSQVVSDCIPSARFCFIPARDAKPIIERILQLFMKEDSSSIGNKLPGKDFYY